MPNYVNTFVDPSQGMRDSFNMVAQTEGLMQGRERNKMLSSQLKMDQERFAIEKMAVPFKFMQMKSAHIQQVAKNIAALPPNQRSQQYGRMLQIAETPIASHEKMGPMGVMETKNFLPLDEFHNSTDEQQTAYLDVMSRSADEVAKLDLSEQQGLSRLEAIAAEAKAEVNKIKLKDKFEKENINLRRDAKLMVEREKNKGRSEIATQKADIKATAAAEDAKPVHSPEDLKFAAEHFVTTGGETYKGRGKTVNKMKQEKILAGIKLAVERGLDPQDFVQNKADIKAISASLLQQEKQHGAMRSFIINIQGQVAEAKNLAKELDQYDTRLFNIPRREWKGKVIGSGLQKRYDLYLEELANETGKVALGATGSVAELSQGAREAWSHILDKSLSPAALNDLLDETHHAVGIRLDSVEQALSFTRNAIQNIGTKGAKPKVTERLDNQKNPKAGTLTQEEINQKMIDYENGL